MKNNHSMTPKSKEKKGIRIGTLIVCFLIACGIWLYAQAIDDDINSKSFNHLQVEVVGNSEFKEKAGYDFHSLNIQNVIVTINGTNRELVKYDAQNIKLIADISSPVNNSATIRAYVIDENGELTEIKNCEVTPPIATINVAKSVSYSVNDTTANLDKEAYNYKLDPLNGTFTVSGPISEVTKISYARFDLNYENVKEHVGTHSIQLSTVSFFDKDGELLFNDTNKNEAVKYDTSSILISVTVESNTSETESTSSSNDK